MLASAAQVRPGLIADIASRTVLIMSQSQSPLARVFLLPYTRLLPAHSALRWQRETAPNTRRCFCRLETRL